mgnify:CR=1 FL=1
MRILVDTNILLDVYLKREPLYSGSIAFLRTAKTFTDEIYVSASTFKDLAYFFKKVFHDDKVVNKKLCDFTRMIIILLFLLYWVGLLLKTSYLTFAIIALILISYIFYRFFRNKRIIVLSLLFFFLGVGVSHINISTSRTDFNGMVVDTKENYYVINSSGEKFYVYEKSNNKEIGDYLHVIGEQESLNFVTLESEFDFNEYLSKKDIYKKFNVYSEECLFKNPIRTKRVRNNFLALFDEKTKGLYSSIMFSNSINGELTNSLRSINISRLISFGGLYIYSFLKIIEYTYE